MSLSFDSMVQDVIDHSLPELQEQDRKDIQRLVDTGVTSYAELVALMRDEMQDSELRGIACWLVGKIGKKKAVHSVLQALHAHEEHLCWEAAKALGNIKSTASVLPLIALLHDGDLPYQRAAAAYALGLLHDHRALLPLVAVVNNRAEDPRVRGHAAEALASLGPDERIVDALLAQLSDPAVEMRFWSVFALGGQHDQRVLPALDHVAQTDHAVLPGWWSISEEATNAIARVKESLVE